MLDFVARLHQCADNTDYESRSKCQLAHSVLSFADMGGITLFQVGNVLVGDATCC